MNTNEIVRQSRFVGFTLVATTLIGFYNTFVLKPSAYGLDVLLANELQFRAAQILDLLMFILVMWMALALYLTTKAVSNHLAKLAFVFRFAEGATGVIVVLLTYMMLVVLKSGPESSGFNEQQLNSMASMFLSIADTAWSMLFIVMGIGALIYLCLFNTAKYIPKWLAYWGIFTYISMIVCFSFKVLLPNFPENVMLLLAPGALFELIFGCWLLFKGVSTEHLQKLNIPKK